MHDIAALSQRVRDQGGKVTSQRVLIWQALADNHTHPTAEELYKHLKPRLPGLSLATLYSALNELVAWGEVRRFDTGDGHIHFDPDISPHAEVICMQCHSVMDVPEIAPPASIPNEVAGYRIVTRSEQFYGYCPICQATIATPATS